jgi:uridine kinase
VPADDVLAAVHRAVSSWRQAVSGVLVVAIDGHGAAGKSTLAASLSEDTGASILHTDDFFCPTERLRNVANRAEGPDAEAVASSRAGRTLADYYDVTRLRAEALEPLRAGRDGVFRRYDWSSAVLSVDETSVAASDLILLEGVYSGAPELADLVHRAILMETPEPERLWRLRRSVAPADWDDEWLQAEKTYFSSMRTPGSFDLVVSGTDEAFSASPLHVDADNERGCP